MLVPSQWIQPGRGTHTPHTRRVKAGISDSCFVSRDPRGHVYPAPGSQPALQLPGSRQAGPASAADQAPSRPNLKVERSHYKHILPEETRHFPWRVCCSQRGELTFHRQSHSGF